MRRMILAVAAIAFALGAAGCRGQGQDRHGCPQSLTVLVGILKSDPSPEVRAKAATDLAARAYIDHPEDLDAVSEALIAALADKDEKVRDDAAWSLEVLSRREPRLASRLLKRLMASWKTASQETQLGWIRALGGDKPAADKLTEHLRSGRPSVEDRETIADILDWCGQEDPVPGLLLLAQDMEMDSGFRAGIVHLLSDEHLCRQTVAPLLGFLKSDPAPAVRARAAEVVFWISSEHHTAEDFKTISEALIGAMADKDKEVRAAVVGRLCFLCECEPSFVARLEKLRTHEDANVRATAAEALQMIRSEKATK